MPFIDNGRVIGNLGYPPTLWLVIPWNHNLAIAKANAIRDWSGSGQGVTGLAKATCDSLGRSVGQSASRSVGQSVSRSVGRSVGRLVGRSVGRMANPHGDSPWGFPMGIPWGITNGFGYFPDGPAHQRLTNSQLTG